MRSGTSKVSRRFAAGATAVAAIAGAALVGTGTASAHEQGRGNGGPDHIFYIMMENHGESQIIGNTADAPFINQLADRYNTATDFHGVTHPSLPNYLSMLSGSHQGIWDDCKAGADVTCAPEEFVPDSGDGTDTASLTPAEIASASAQPHMFNGRNLVDQLEAKGLSWKAYMQSMPTAGYEGEYAPTVDGTTVKLYAQKHNPFMYFSDINSPGNPRLKKIVPFETSFAKDLNSGHVPDFTWISPDQCHDMHGIAASGAALVGMPDCVAPATGLDHSVIRMGDDFLHTTVDQIMQSRTWRTTNSSIVIAWDENDYSGYSGGPGSPVGANGTVLGGGDAPLLVVNSHQGQHPKRNDEPTDHYSVLATVERLWNLGCLDDTCSRETSGSVRDLFPRG